MRKKYGESNLASLMKIDPSEYHIRILTKRFGFIITKVTLLAAFLRYRDNEECQRMSSI